MAGTWETPAEAEDSEADKAEHLVSSSRLHKEKRVIAGVCGRVPSWGRGAVPCIFSAMRMMPLSMYLSFKKSS